MSFYFLSPFPKRAEEQKKKDNTKGDNLLEGSYNTDELDSKEYVGENDDQQNKDDNNTEFVLCPTPYPILDR